MKRGNLRVAYDPTNKMWAVQGRKANGAWYNSYDEERKTDNKNLLFNIKYDACGYLQSLVDFTEEQRPVEKALNPIFNRKSKYSKGKVKRRKK